MARGNEIPPPDLILANSAWLHRFTRKLVHDADLAEDVGQEALLAGLSKPGSSRAGASRPWLAGVARNVAIALARNAKRRRRAEQAASRTGTAPETADVAAELELQSAAVHALLNLHEPYQTTLFWRFMKGLSAREIAKRSKVPVETVRARIKRGLALLRAKLDQEHGGRRGWLPPIGAPAIWRQSTPALWGIVLMEMKTKVLAAAALLLAGLLSVWFVTSPASPGLRTPRNAASEMVGTAQVDTVSEEVEGEPDRRVLDVGFREEVATGSLIVRVIWEDNGLPAEGVGTRLRVTDDWTEYGSFASTGPDGEAEFADLRPGKVKLSTDRTNSSWEREVRGGLQEVLEIGVPRAIDVRGIVVDRNGVGVAGAQVIVTGAGVSPQWFYPSTTTAADGTFFLRSLGTKLVAARAEGYGTSDLAFVYSSQHPDGEAELRLVLPAAPAELIGRVYDPEGHPVGGAHVTIGNSHVSGGGPPQNLLRTDAEGSFRVRHMKPDRYRVFIYGSGFAYWKGVVELRGRETTELLVPLEAGADLYGRVTDADGLPLRDVTVEAPYTGWPHRSSASTDEAGAYRLKDLPSGEITVTIRTRQLDNQVRTWNLLSGEERRQDIVLEAGLQIRGILLDSEGNPLAGCWISHQAPRSGMNYFARTDTEGRFVLANCEDGQTYDVRVQGGMGFLPTLHLFRAVVPMPEEQEFRVPASSMPSATVVGRVLGPDSNPAQGVTLALKQNGGNLWSTSQPSPIPQPAIGPVDARGRFEIGPLPPGEYDISATHPDFASAELGTVTLLPGELRELPVGRLRHGARLEVALLADFPEQLFELRLQLQDLQGKRVRDGSVSGRNVTFPVLGPGSYQLSVAGANIEAQLLAIELKAQEALSLEIELR